MPVGARHGNAARLQCGDHRHGERMALAHEDQDVAGADRPSSGIKRSSPSIQRLIVVGDAVGQPLGWRALARVGERRPRIGRYGVIRFLGRPDFDEPRLTEAVRSVRDEPAAGGQSRACGRIGKNLIDGAEHRRDRAERQIERQRTSTAQRARCQPP